MGKITSKVTAKIEDILEEDINPSTKEKQISQMMTRVATDSSDSCIVYTGMAEIGAETSEAVWKITRYDESVDEVAKFVDNGEFTQIWDNHEALVYE